MKKLLLVLPLLISACAADGSFESYGERSERQRIEKINRLSDESRQRDNQPNEYAYNEGTKHGCNSGYNAGGDFTRAFYKDVNQYVDNRYYKTGWDDGFMKCKSVADIAGQSIDNSLRTSPLDVGR